MPCLALGQERTLRLALDAWIELGVRRPVVETTKGDLQAISGVSAKRARRREGRITKRITCTRSAPRRTHLDQKVAGTCRRTPAQALAIIATTRIDRRVSAAKPQQL
jgi:hypothetical protein